MSAAGSWGPSGKTDAGYMQCSGGITTYVIPLRTLPDLTYRPKEESRYYSREMNYQIRLRVDKEFSDIEYIKDWLDITQKGFAFLHDKEDNHHYHIYLFGINREADSLRKTLLRYTQDKQAYSVKTTAGKRKDKILPVLAWQYATEAQALNPVWVKGFDKEAIDSFVTNASTYYELEAAKQTMTGVTHEDHYIVRPDRVWERLSLHKDKYKDKTVKQIKSMMCAEWLNNGKAIPRSADLHRYAVSLYMANKYVEVPDDAFITETENGQI